MAHLAERWAADGWPARVDETGTALTAEYSAPSAGPPPWHVYRITVDRATALGDGGAGRGHQLDLLTLARRVAPGPVRPSPGLSVAIGAGSPAGGVGAPLA